MASFAIALVDILQGRERGNYQIWSRAIVAVISIAFIFDLRDSASYLYLWVKGKILA
ncbi:MAG: hypothetical protein J7647_26825 [Cyanobacteria bacterium SBLK]|nr:hypothetical protein [Cyanobacteria bacterium SBLK]